MILGRVFKYFKLVHRTCIQSELCECSIWQLSTFDVSCLEVIWRVRALLNKAHQLKCQIWKVPTGVLIVILILCMYV